MSDHIDRAVEVLATEIHEAWEFQYDECDHGEYRGGHLHGERYAMCRLAAERIIGRRAAAGLIRARDAEVRAERRNFRSVPEGMVWQDYYSPDEVMQIREQVRDEVMREMSDRLRAHAPKADIAAFMRQQP